MVNNIKKFTRKAINLHDDKVWNNEFRGTIYLLSGLVVYYYIFLVTSFTSQEISIILVNGFVQGAFYALLAVGFSIIFGVARMFKLSIGGYFVLGAYTAYWLTKMMEMRINYIRDQPVDSPSMLINKFIIYAPLLGFVALLVYYYQYFGRKIGSGVIVSHLVLFVLQRELLVQNYNLFSLASTIKAIFILDAVLLAGFALIYLELSDKQVLSGIGILHFLTIFLNLDSTYPDPPGIYIAIFIVSIIFVAVLSMLVDRYILEKARDNPTNVLIITFGIALLVQSIVPVLKYPEGEGFTRFDIIQRNLDGIVLKTENITVFDVTVQTLRIIATILSLVFLILIYLFINKTPMGRAMEAVSEDPDAAWLVGIDVRKVYLIATGLGMGLAAAAAILVTPFIAQPYWGVYMGWAPLIFAIAVVTLGGLGSIFGSAVAGFIIGFAEQTIAFDDISLSRIVPLIAIFLIMLLRPNGLFGVEEDEE